KVALAAVVGAVQGAMGKIGECLAGVGNNASSTSNVDLRDTLNKPWANAGMDGTRIKSGYDVYREKTYNYFKTSKPYATDSQIYGDIARSAPWKYKFKAIGDYIFDYSPIAQGKKYFNIMALNYGMESHYAELYSDFTIQSIFETGFTIAGKGLKAASALKSGEALLEGEIVAGSGIGNLKGTETSYVKSIDDLKNTENFKDSALKHILEGEINKRGKAVGFHYEGFPTTKGNIIEGTKSLPDELGVYTGRVEVSGIPKTSNGGQSTFFPESWTAQDIVDAINQAYVNKTFVRGNTYIGTLPSGMKIEMFIDQYGNIISAYPKF
ncbi:EndoU domain-containing protein, partial [Clostridium butyricum]